MPPRQKARPRLPPLKPHIYCVHFICAVSAGMGGGARRAWISAYTGQFYRRAIFVLFCIFPRSTPLPRRRGAPYVNIPQIPVQRCSILLHFVLYWVQNQHSRAAPGAKEATHEQHHRGKTRGHPQQRQPDAAGGHRRAFAGFMDLLACPQAERLLHRHSGRHVGADVFDYTAYIRPAYQLRV